MRASLCTLPLRMALFLVFESLLLQAGNPFSFLVSLYFRGHNGIDIGSLAMDPRGRYAATGEISPQPRIHIWDAITGQPIARLQFLHRKGNTACLHLELCMCAMIPVLCVLLCVLLYV